MDLFPGPFHHEPLGEDGATASLVVAMLEGFVENNFLAAYP